MKLRTIRLDQDEWSAEDPQSPFYYEEKPDRIKITLKSFDKKLKRVHLTYSIEPAMRVAWNGFQSWSSGGVYEWGERLKKPPRIAKRISEPLGDYHFISYDQDLHSFQMIYLDYPGQGLFLGSCDESNGYTIFHVNYEKRQLVIEKDCEGEQFSEKPLLEVERQFGEYAKTLQLFSRSKPISSEKITGWTSWYNYYTKIDESILLNNLQGIENEKLPFDVFQIDDGYQQAVGDWLVFDKGFPRGLTGVVDRIHDLGMEAGLWLAPFVAEKKSDLARNHPEWILKDEKGKWVEAGWNPGWSGSFYALDLSNETYRAYLESVFSTVFEQWGFDMVKLDFLYAGAMIPREGRSRGRQAKEALDWIRSMTAGKKVLLCGAPFSQILGFEGYARIGSDVKPKWEDPILKAIHYRERVSTKNSLVNTLLRSALNGVGIQCDPDVFFWRKNVKLTETEKETLMKVNYLCGNLLFTSDAIHEMDAAELRAIRKMFPLKDVKVLEMQAMGEFFEIAFSVDDESYTAWVNLAEEKRTLSPASRTCHYQIPTEISPHACLVRKQRSQAEIVIVESDGHWIPGAEIKWTIQDNHIRLASQNGLTTQVRISANTNQYLVNDKQVVWKWAEDRYYAIIDKAGIR